MVDRGRLRAISNFHPLVRESGLLNGRTTGIGAERFCDFGKGNRIEERITDYSPGESMRVAITDTAKFPMTEAYGTLSVRPLGTDRSEVTFRFDYRPKYGPIGWAMGRTVMALQFRRLLGSVIDGLEEYGRTGIPQEQAS